MDIKEVINRIGYFRNKINLSARELSLQIGKQSGYINKLETMGFNLPTNVLLEIIEALEITPEEFFADNYSTYKIDKELVTLVNLLPVDKRKSMIDFIKK